MTRLIIFDLDGTLLNTLEDIADASNYMLERHGFPTHPLDAYRYFVGNGMPTLIQRVLPEEHKTGDVYEQCFKDFIAYYTQHMYDKTHVYEGMAPTLAQLQAQGVLLAVATNKVQAALPPLMARYFPGIRWSSLLGQRPGIPVKPDPQIVHDILAETQCTQTETLYIGDTRVDMETAHGAGLKAIGALWGFRTREELENAGADTLIERPVELLSCIEK